MKNNILIISIIALILASCDMKEDYEQIDSKAVQYTGEWTYQLLSDDMSAVYAGYGAGKNLLTYNTSADLANAIWIDDQKALFPMKYKAVMNGDLSSFSASRSDNEYFTSSINYPKAAKVAGVANNATGQYKAYEVLDGSILLGIATSKDGNKVDSLFLRVICYLDMFDVTSEIKSIDTTWNRFNADSNQTWKVDTTVHVLDPNSSWVDQNWVQINDTVYYQIDSTGSWKYVVDSTLGDIDTTIGWTAPINPTEISEEYVISGHRTSGFLEDIY